MEVRTGGIVKNSGIVAWAEPDPKTAFFAFLGYPSTVLRTAYSKQLYPKPMVPIGKPRLKVCLLLVWRVCDQTFGRYRQTEI